IPSLDALGTALEAYLAEVELRRLDLQLLLGTDELPGFVGGTRDLGVFLERLRDAAEREAPTPAALELLEALGAARVALGRSVMASALGARYDAPRYAGMAGVSVFLPHDASELRGHGDAFAAARLYGLAPAWRAWLDRLFA